MYTPNPLQPGSSVSHWNTAFEVGTIDEIMEPAATGEGVVPLRSSPTLALMEGIGWTIDFIPAGSAVKDWSMY
jgi:hypothetical protein